MKFNSVDSTLEKYLQKLKGEVELIIVLSHRGYYADRLLAERIKGVDVIIGGHSHTKIDKPALVGDTIIVQAWEHGKALGVLDLTFENVKITKFNGYLEEINPEKVVEDITVKKIVEKYNKNSFTF